MTVLLPVGRARDIAASASALAPVRRPLASSIGCVLAQPLTAQQSIPHTANSAMDGWAVTAGRQHGWRLRPDGAHRPETLLAGLEAGEAVAVVTGSPVPEGTYSVLRSEHGRVEHEHAPAGPVLHADPATPDLESGRNIRPEAAEATAGDLLCEPGKLLTPAWAAAAAVAGYDDLLVIPHPRVRLLLTGGEVKTSGVPARGEVRDVFGLALPSMVATMGGEVEDAHRLGDDAAALAGLMEESSAEVIITTGGTAHSRADVLRPALKRLGAEILVGSVDMRPGHPALLARTSSSYVIGLPGNPLAGFAALAVLAEPLLRALRGIVPAVSSRSLSAGSALPGARRGVRLLPVKIRGGEVHGLDHTRAHMMRGLADADAFAVVPAAGASAGDPVECLAAPGGSARIGALAGWGVQ